MKPVNIAANRPVPNSSPAAGTGFRTQAVPRPGTQDRYPLLRKGGLTPRIGAFTQAAFVGWAIALLVMIIRILRLTHRGTTFGCFIDAGHHWRNGEPIYIHRSGMGFVYSPLFAAYFAIYSFLPLWAGKILWLLTNVGLLVGGTWSAMWAGVFRIPSDRARALVLILLLPLSLANLDVAQSNSALIGLLLFAVALASRERWMLSAVAICIATYLKIYPLVFGLVLCVYEPRKVPWRLAVALSGFGSLSLFLQRPQYVLAQYHGWVTTRVADDRRLNSMAHAPLDLWFLLVRLGHLPISEHFYVALQILSGVAIGVFCAFVSRARWPRERVLAGIFLLCSCWVILLGPATESYTFAILAPAVCLGTVTAFTGAASAMARALAGLAISMLLAAQIRNSFSPGWHSVLIDGLRPAGAFLFLCYAILWLRDDTMWKQGQLPA